MYVDRTDRPVPKKIISLFDHEKFIMSLKRESDVLNLSPQEIIENDADDIFNYWLKLGLRTPRSYKMTSDKIESRKQFVKVMRGRHPNISAKLSKQEILNSITHFGIAVSNPDFAPAPEKKKNIKGLSIIEFIYKDFTPKSKKPPIKSHLLFYLDPPRPLIKEINPKLTEKIRQLYISEKWGNDVSESETIKIAERPDFVRASNRIIKYLREVDKYLEPLMGLSLLHPERAAHALIKANNVARGEFIPAWLSNDISLSNLDRWLRNQGFFRPTYRAV